MQTFEETLLHEIEVFCRTNGIKPSTLCRKAAGDNLLFERLMDGGDCGIRKADKIRLFIDNFNKKKETTDASNKK